MAGLLPLSLQALAETESFCRVMLEAEEQALVFFPVLPSTGRLLEGPEIRRALLKVVPPHV